MLYRDPDIVRLFLLNPSNRSSMPEKLSCIRQILKFSTMNGRILCVGHGQIISLYPDRQLCLDSTLWLG